MKRKLVLGLIVLLIVYVGFVIRHKFYACDEICRTFTEDTYGGKTPEETLNLFTLALRAGDVELASRYFMLGPDLKRDKWVRTLIIFKERGLLDDMAQDIEKKPDLVELRLNEYSGVWKIVDFR